MMVQLFSLACLFLLDLGSISALVPPTLEGSSSGSSKLHYRNQIQADYDVGSGCGGTNMHSLGAFWKIPKLRNQPTAHTDHDSYSATSTSMLEGSCGGSHMGSLSAMTEIPKRRLDNKEEVSSEEEKPAGRTTTNNGCGGSNMNSLSMFPEIPKLRNHPSASLYDGYYQAADAEGLCTAVAGCGGTYMESVGAFPVTHPVGAAGGNTDTVVYQQNTPLFERYQQLRQAELQYQQLLAESTPLKGNALYAPDPRK
jgi:hypothetical protein